MPTTESTTETEFVADLADENSRGAGVVVIPVIIAAAGAAGAFLIRKFRRRNKSEVVVLAEGPVTDSE